MSDQESSDDNRPQRRASTNYQEVNQILMEQNLIPGQHEPSTDYHQYPDYHNNNQIDALINDPQYPSFNNTANFI